MNSQPRTFFTADLHFSHLGMITKFGRPYANANDLAQMATEEGLSSDRKAELIHTMNEDIISNWNDDVHARDTVYILGDVFFCNATKAKEYLERMNGTKILVFGNHDKVIHKNPDVKQYFKETHTLLERNFPVGAGAQFIVMCHYSMRTWNHRHHGSLHLFGHSHGLMPDDGSRSMDVGMDCHNMRVVSLEDVIQKLCSRTLTKTEDQR